MIGRSVVAITILVAAAGCGGDAASDDGPSAPLTVPQALQTRPTQVIEVRGIVIATADGSARLCEGLAGSYPPQCAGKSVAVEGLDPQILERSDTAEGVTWGTATLRGRLHGDVFKLS